MYVPGLPDFSGNGKNITNKKRIHIPKTIKYTKRPQNIPNGYKNILNGHKICIANGYKNIQNRHKIYQMPTKYTKEQ
jgi:hypothetical protein